MSNYALAGNANWSTANPNGGGVGVPGPPGATDNIYLNGFILTLDGATGSTYTCASISATTNGSTKSNGTIALPAGTYACTIAANISAGLQNLLVPATGKTVVINGIATGGDTGIMGINFSGTSLTVTESRGGSGSSSYGTNIAAGTGHILTSRGGGGVNAFGCVTSGGTMTIDLAVGGTHASASGVVQYGGTLKINDTDLTATGQPYGLGVLQLADAAVLRFQDLSGNAKRVYGYQRAKTRMLGV